MVITLLTDFGNQDGFTGVMKGVILSRTAADIVDLSHEISPQNIQQAAFVLHNSWQYFPPGSVHVVVVDPGVGSDRAILAVKAADNHNGRHVPGKCCHLQVSGALTGCD